MLRPVSRCWQSMARQVALEVIAGSRRVRTRVVPYALAAGTSGTALAICGAVIALSYVLFLKPLPYPTAEDVYVVRSSGTDGSARTLSLQQVKELDAIGRGMFDVAWYHPQRFVLSRRLVDLAAASVSSGFFGLLGTSPILGTLAGIGSDMPAIVLTERVWRSQFGADSTVIGTVLSEGELRFRVAAVMPEAFDWPLGVEVWLVQVRPSQEEADIRQFALLTALVRAQDPQVVRRLQNQRIGGDVLEVRSLEDAVLGRGRQALGILGVVSFLLLTMTAIGMLALVLSDAVALSPSIRTRMFLGSPWCSNAVDPFRNRQRVSCGLAHCAIGNSDRCVKSMGHSQVNRGEQKCSPHCSSHPVSSQPGRDRSRLDCLGCHTTPDNVTGYK
jgi:hypothetical protein